MKGGIKTSQFVMTTKNLSHPSLELPAPAFFLLPGAPFTEQSVLDFLSLRKQILKTLHHFRQSNNIMLLYIEHLENLLYTQLLHSPSVNV